MIAGDVMLTGEHVLVPERIIVAPAAGVFWPRPPECVTVEGELVTQGQVLGHVRGPGSEVEVRSMFRGYLMGMLAHAGERMREGQPVAWLRTF